MLSSSGTISPVICVSATKNTCSYSAPTNSIAFSSRTALRAPSQPATHAAVISVIVPSGCFSVALTLLVS